MAKTYYLPQDDEGKGLFLANLNSKLADYSATLGTSPTDLADVAEGTQAFNWALGKISEIRTSTQQWTAFKNILRDGPESLPTNPPTLPTLGTIPPNLAPGVFVRIIEIVNRIKTSPAYTEAIGEDLGIIGPEHSVDLVNIKPTLTLRLIAGQPEIVWKKQGMTALEIHVDRGLGWQFLAVDTVPNYTDTAPQPPAGALWKYKAIYRLGDTLTGQWSDIGSISVAG